MKKTYFVCEDKRILDRLKAEFGGEKNVEFWDDPTFIDSLKDTDFVVGVYDSDKKSSFYNMNHHEFHALYFMKLAPFQSIVQSIHKHLYGMEKLDEVLKGIENGSFTVKFAEYRFGGGSHEDVHRFDLLNKSDVVVGPIEFLDLDGFYLYLGDEVVYRNEDCYDYRVDREERVRVKDVLREALTRDDKEYAALYADEQGSITVPRCYSDVDRTEALQEKFKEESWPDIFHEF